VRKGATWARTEGRARTDSNVNLSRRVDDGLLGELNVDFVLLLGHGHKANEELAFLGSGDEGGDGA